MRDWRPVIRKVNAWAQDAQGFANFAKYHETETRAALADFVAALAPYDVFHDAPFGHTHIHPFVRKVLAPEAKFIWMNRDMESWLASVRNWEETHPEIYPKHVNWTNTPKRQVQIRKRFWRRQYRKFNQMRRGAPKDCLELEWRDMQSFDALAAFYGVPAPEGALPRENVSLD